MLSKGNQVYYVYVYYDPRNGEPIYVGLGTGKRAFKHWKKGARNPFFNNVLEKLKKLALSPRIEFVALELFLEEAKALEKQLIALYGRRDLNKGTLCNLTDGGEGVFGYVRSLEAIEATRKGSLKFWDTADKKEHGLKISQVFASRTKEELKIVSENIKNSRTPEVISKIAKGTKDRMTEGTEFKHKVLVSLQTKEARAKRKKALKEYSNSEQGREQRRRAANARWAKMRTDKQSNTFQGE